jgi:ABC-type multidrug transport system fused ATPase/permease subunit
MAGFSLRVKAGRSIALVGQSGSGKSTIIGLIERYYDPLKGEVRIDGKDIKRLHLQTLRRHIALVGQEPTLFAGTIRENILYGRENATEAEIIEAAKAANAHNFIRSPFKKLWIHFSRFCHCWVFVFLSLACPPTLVKPWNGKMPLPCRSRIQGAMLL